MHISIYFLWYTQCILFKKKGYFHIFPRKHFLYYKRKSFDQLLNTKYIGTFTFPVLVKKLFPSVYPHTWTQTYTLTNTSLLIYNGSFKLRYAYNHISIFWRISKTFLSRQYKCTRKYVSEIEYIQDFSVFVVQIYCHSQIYFEFKVKEAK